MYRTDAETIKYFCKMQSDTQIEFLNKDFPKYQFKLSNIKGDHFYIQVQNKNPNSKNFVNIEVLKYIINTKNSFQNVVGFDIIKNKFVIIYQVNLP